MTLMARVCSSATVLIEGKNVAVKKERGQKDSLIVKCGAGHSGLRVTRKSCNSLRKLKYARETL